MAKSRQRPSRPAPAPRPKPSAKPKKKGGGKGSLILWLLILTVSAISFFLVLTAGAEQVKLLSEKFGLWQGLGISALVFLLALLIPPLWLGRKAKGGSAWFLLFWNLALLGAAYGLAPLGEWFSDRGAQVPAMILGQENPVVQRGLIEKLAWGLGSDSSADSSPDSGTKKPVRPARELPIGANDKFDLQLYEELVREGHRGDVERYLTRFPEGFAVELDSSPAGVRMAIRKGNVDLVKYFLESGLELNSVSGLLLDAARISPKDPRKEAMVRLVLSKGADPNETNSQGGALHFVQNERLAKTLVSAGTTLDHLDDKGRTALHVLVEHDRPFCAKVFLQAGAQVNVADDLGRTPLYYAAGSPRTVALLVTQFADVYQVDKDGKTAQIFIEEELVAIKAREEHKDDADKTLTEFKVKQYQKSIDLMNRPKDARKLVDGFQEGPVRRYHSLDETYSAEFPVEPRQHPYEMVSSVTVAGGRFSIGAKTFASPEDKEKAQAETAKRSNDKQHKEFEVQGYPAVRALRDGRMSQWVWVEDTVYLAIASHAAQDDMNIFLDSFKLHPENFPKKD